MKNAIVKLGFCLLFFFVAQIAHATPPSVVVKRNTASPTNLTSGIQFTVTFSAPVNGFSSSDVVLTNDSGTPTNGSTTISVLPAAGPAAVYTVTVDVVTAGTFTVSVPPAAATEAAVPNDPSIASTQGSPIPQIVIDTTKPNVTITQPSQTDPTTGESQIAYLVTFSKDIDASTFTASDISFTGSGGGLVLSVNAINQVVATTKYEVLVDIDPTSTGNQHVIMTIPAGGVSDFAGNTNNASSGGDNDVTYAGILPTSAQATATSTSTSIIITGNVLTTGGRTVSDKGTVWKAGASGVALTDNSFAEGSGGLGTFTRTRSIGIMAHTHYWYATWAQNAVGKKLSPENDIWTLTDPPTASGALTSATATSGSTIDLVFPAYAAGADGIVILRKTGGTAVTAAELLMGQVPSAQPGYVTVISSNSATTFTDTGLSGGQQYSYVAVPFTVFGSQTETTNYQTTLTPQSATTITALSRIVENNPPANTLAYETKQSMVIDAASKGLSLADVVLLDGNAPANDADGNDTDLKTLTIHVNNFANIGHIALLDNTTIVDEGVLDALGNITFDIPTGQLVGPDDDNNGDQFNIIANFTAVVTDGAVIRVTVTGATVWAGSSGLVSASAGGYDTGPTKNAIAVVATKFVFSGPPAGLKTNVLFGFTATLEDALNNIDTNLGGNLVLTEGTLVGTKTQAFSSGVATFSGLKFNSAGHKDIDLDATNWSPTSNGTLSIDIASNGVIITGPNTPAPNVGPTQAVLCFNSSNTDAGQPGYNSGGAYVTLADIVIKESESTDFTAGTNQTFALQLPTGFVFDPSVNPTVTSTSGSELANVSFTSFTSLNTILRFKYDVTGASNPTADAITISGAKVKYNGTTPVTLADIVRVAGTAQQNNNSDTQTILQSHGKLSAANGIGDVTFEVTNSSNTAETRYSKNGIQLLILQGKDGSGLLNGTFTGQGVGLDNDGKWKFNLSGVAPGLYDITFTTTSATTPFCTSTVTRTFQIYTTIINGLNDRYCEYEPNATLTGYSNFNTTGYCLGTLEIPFLGLQLPGFLFSVPNSFSAYPINGTGAFEPFIWLDNFGGINNIPRVGGTAPAGSQQFDPDAAMYSATLAASGGVIQIGYRRKSDCASIPQPNPAFGNYQPYTGFLPNGDDYFTAPVSVNKRPVIDFTFRAINDGTGGICATGSPEAVVAPLYNPADITDHISASLFNDAANEIAGAIVEDVNHKFTFDPTKANVAATLDKHIQINFTHRDPSSLCVNSISHDFEVWRRPDLVPDINITIKGASTLAGQFCEGENVTNFTGTDPSKIYQWYTEGPTALKGIGKDFFPNLYLPLQGNGTPAFVKTNFDVTQVEHRQGIFEGCESNQKQISIEIFKAPTQTAGTTTICESSDHILLANIGAVLKMPNGTDFGGHWGKGDSTIVPRGVFKNSGGVNNVFPNSERYEPTPDEYTAGKVLLVLVPDHPAGPCAPITQRITVPITPAATVNFPAAPYAYCATNTDMPVDALVTNITDYTWTVVTPTNGSIKVGTEKKATAIFNPSAAVAQNGGDVVLQLQTVDPDGPSGPCDLITKTMTVHVDQRPLVEAPADFSICTEDHAIQFTLDATKPNFSSADTWVWSKTVGPVGSTNTFSNANSQSTIYTPDPATEDLGLVSKDSVISLTFSVRATRTGNVCTYEEDFVTVAINGRPVAPVPDVINPYCVGQTIDLLSTRVALPKWYKADPSGNKGPQFSTSQQTSSGVSSAVAASVPFWLTQTFSGCESDTTRLKIVINPNPTPKFDFVNQCLGDIMQFTDQSTISQPSFGGTRSIVLWNWDFDDEFGETGAGAPGDAIVNNQGGSTSGNYKDPGHKYTKTGTYSASLTLTSNDGCALTFTHNPVTALKPLKVGPVPVADFTAALLCDEDGTEFTSSNGLPPATVVTYVWDFGNAGASSTDINPTNTFTGPGTYDVTLSLTTDLNCKSTIIKPTSIFPYIKSFPYIQDFEASTHGWVPDGFVTNGGNVTSKTSWTRLTSAGSITPDTDPNAGSTFWATHTNAGSDLFYYDNERSVLYGPCVDMTLLPRPVVALDYFSDTELKGDGAYLEYRDESTNIDTVWVRLGDNGSGLNWYNDNSIGGLSQLDDVGQTLGQFGWDGTSAAWTTGRYNLDNLAKKKRVRFRIVFGSNSSPVSTDIYDGFAIDNFKLETRNRLVLVENFTSASTTNPNVGLNTAAFKTFPSASTANEVVKIEYHTGLPASTGDPQDPIFTQNPMDPNARASFYGLSAVPRGYIDGYTDKGSEGFFTSTATNHWASSEYSTESLRTSPILLTIDDPTITNGTMNITGKVIPKEFALPGNSYSLYIAVVEETVGTNAFVLRRMLPSAAGIKVPLTSINAVFPFNVSWEIDKSYLSSDSPHLIAVAFVQADIPTTDPAGNSRRVVLQAAYNSNAPTVTFTTGLEIATIEQIAVYPNPADHLVNIELPEPTKTGVEIHVFDQVGRSVGQASIGIGQQSTSLDTSNLAATLYFIQLKENGGYTTRKLLVTHKH
ncbi:MAG: T9SS type A sorting domain-containing protein [Bacteroidota bacterium]